MRELTQPEIDDMISFGGSASDVPGTWIEAKVSELAEGNIGTACGGPDTFIILTNKGYPHRKVRGYLIHDSDESRSYLIGVIGIKIQTEKTAFKVERVIGAGGSYLRFEGPADPGTTLDGFMIFEDE